MHTGTSLLFQLCIAFLVCFFLQMLIVSTLTLPVPFPLDSCPPSTWLLPVPVTLLCKSTSCCCGFLICALSLPVVLCFHFSRFLMQFPFSPPVLGFSVADISIAWPSYSSVCCTSPSVPFSLFCQPSDFTLMPSYCHSLAVPACLDSLMGSVFSFPSSLFPPELLSRVACIKQSGPSRDTVESSRA